MTTKIEDRFIPLTKWNKYHPWPSLAGLRHLAFYRDTNGFHVCLRKVGRRLLISEKTFLEWLDKQNAQVKVHASHEPRK
ncbi:MAG: hypothetical protein COY40_02640 [Alphaproteobacteria bacterium CG_4_10_14_0_8_um_filter_53_9]|nr:MAG: hypothetical protein COY40_02640 [Alphaproteobacteria bacterium CG_4_10_14_0_8_um_filter_53_9]